MKSPSTERNVSPTNAKSLKMPKVKEMSPDLETATLSSREKYLDNEVKVLKNRDPVEFRAYLRRMDFWFRENRAKLVTLLKWVAGGKKRVGFATMKRALLDLNVPCSRLQLHAMCLELDRRGTRKIKVDLPRRLSRREPPVIYSLQKESLEDRHTFMSIHLKFLPLLSDTYLPCHFQATVRSDMYVGRLTELINERTKLRATKWNIYCSKETHRSLPLPPNFILDQLRVNVGSERNPGVIELFYSGDMEFLTCPLLLCDYYCHTPFRQYKRLAKEERANLAKDGLNEEIVEKCFSDKDKKNILKQFSNTGTDYFQHM